MFYVQLQSQTQKKKKKEAAMTEPREVARAVPVEEANLKAWGALSTHEYGHPGYNLHKGKSEKAKMDGEKFIALGAYYSTQLKKPLSHAKSMFCITYGKRNVGHPSINWLITYGVLLSHAKSMFRISCIIVCNKSQWEFHNAFWRIKI